jgi:hypothetical protein
MANSNTDLIRDTLVDAIFNCYQKGYLTDTEYKNMMDDFAYHFDSMANVVKERPLKSSEIDWSKPGARYEDELVIIH